MATHNTVNSVDINITCNLKFVLISQTQDFAWNTLYFYLTKIKLLTQPSYIPCYLYCF